MKELLGISSLSDLDIERIFQTAQSFQSLLKNSKENPKTSKETKKHFGKRACLFFVENSTRTRISFEVACKNLGVDPILFQTSGSSLAKGESLLDTLYTLDAYDLDVLIARTPHSGTPQFLKKYTKTPIINAGDGTHEHPTQALLDAFTLKNQWGNLKQKRICLLGDVIHSRVAGSNIRLLSRLGAKVILCGPGSLLPRKLPEQWVQEYQVEVQPRIERAIEGADAVMTWRLQKERMDENLIPSFGDYSRGWKLTEEKMNSLCPNAFVLHPGPANRDVEIESKLLDSKRCLAKQQVENGVYIRMAVLDWILDVE